MATRRSRNDDDDDFWRQWTFAEEDRRLHTSAPWDGGGRWFRSLNVVRLEVYLRPPPAALPPNWHGAEIVTFRRKKSV